MSDTVTSRLQLHQEIQALLQLDEQCLSTEPIIDELIRDGLQALSSYRSEIIQDIYENQMNSTNSELYNILRHYHQQPLFNMLKNVNIPKRNNLYDAALDSIVENGWIKGIQIIEKKVTPKQYKSILNIIESTIEMSQQQQDTKNELELISHCCISEKKFNFVELVQAGELMYLNQTLKNIVSSIFEATSSDDYSYVLRSSLTPIMYLLKRKQCLKEFIALIQQRFYQLKRLQAKKQVYIPTISLRMFFYVLMMNSDLFLQRYLMKLLCSRNPVPFYEFNGEFVHEIIHIWDYTHPTLLSFGVGPCPGKSSLLNSLFMSSFEVKIQSIFFRQTIDIDFGYNFIPPRPSNIADAHGQIDKKLLSRLTSLFDGYLIHVEQSYLDQHLDVVIEYLEILSDDKFRILIVRDATEPQLTKLSHCENIFSLSNISNSNDRNIQFIVEELHNEITTKFDKMRDFDNTQLCYSGKVLTNVLRSPEQCETDSDAYIFTLMDRLSFDDDTYDFPLYSKYIELRQKQMQLAAIYFRGYGTIAIFELCTTIWKLENALKPQTSEKQECGLVFDTFVSLLAEPSQTMLMHLDELASELQRANKKSLSNISLEVLWRNAIVCFDHCDEGIQQRIIQCYYKFIAAGFPFEIIDGDNFYFQHKFLAKVLSNFREKKILVISIIGPQNSGKSTLLNYMFGTLFDVRDGRCTRGIYGSLVKSNIVKSDFDYIMLIDTEGLLSVEKDDKEYDRRLVLFCLAVSHLVIVNMVDQLNEPLKSILTLCADSLRNIGVSKVNRPAVHFVLNQKSDPSIENHKTAIKIILEEIETYELSTIIDINEQTFHTLPSAFYKSTGLLRYQRTEPEFVEKTQQLCGHFLESSLKTSGQIYDILLWLRLSTNIFDMLQKFPDLTYFVDINEQRKNKEIFDYIRQLILNTFTADYRRRLINSTRATLDGIDELFQIEFQEHHDQLTGKLEQMLTQASVRIRDRSREFLSTQILETRRAWRIAAIENYNRKKLEIFVRDGSDEIRCLIDDMINSGEINIDRTSAIHSFDEMWNKKVENIRANFNKNEVLKQSLSYIYCNYSIFEKKHLPSYNNILYHLSFLEQLIHDTIRMDRYEQISVVAQQIYHKIHHIHVIVEEHPFRPDPSAQYTFNTVLGFVHLNRSLLEHEFYESIITHSLVPAKGSRIPVLISKRSAEENIQQLSFLQTARVARILTCKYRLQIRKLLHNSPHKILSAELLFDQLIQQLLPLLIDVSVDIDLIQRINGIILSLVTDVNLELVVFDVSLSVQVIYNIHACILLLLTIIYFDQQRTCFDCYLTKFIDNKDALQAYFLQMVTPDKESDVKISTKLINELKRLVLSSYEEDARILITDAIQQYHTLNRRIIQEHCDGKLLTGDNSWLMRYIENPTDIVVEEFNRQWTSLKQSLNQQLCDLHVKRLDILLEFFRRLRLIFNMTRTRGPAAHFIDDAFTSSGGVAYNNIRNKGNCMSKLLFHYLSGLQSFDFSVSGTYYELKKPIFDIWQQLPVVSSELVEITKTMKDIYEQSRITNLTHLLTQIETQQVATQEEFLSKKITFDKFDFTGEIYNNLLVKARGCTALCPCCSRPCDVDHSPVKATPGVETAKHCCQTGHQFRAMAGIRFEVSNQASLFQCEQINDDQIIIVQGTKKRWSEFKNDYSMWDFGSLLDEETKQRHFTTYMSVWGKIGQNICKKFGMKFLMNPSQYVRYVSYHYIMVLDCSGSMNGKPWADLLDAIKDFVHLRKEAETNDRLSIIRFCDVAERIQFYKSMNEEPNLSHIQCSGNTSFKNAFALVNETIEKTIVDQPDDSLDRVVIFMSDGQAIIPGDELDRLLMQPKAETAKFWTVALGKSEMSILEKMNRKMNGTFKNIRQSSDLIQTYAEIARS